jgi:hypothetical protein
MIATTVLVATARWWAIGALAPTVGVALVWDRQCGLTRETEPS